MLYALPYTQPMLRDYIRVALEHVHYELIEDAEPAYGEVPELRGVQATGETLEACRNNLESTLEGWLLARLLHKFRHSGNQRVAVAPPKNGYC